MSEESNDYLTELEGDTPAADWRENGQPDPHGDRYHCRRDDLLMGHLSDDQMANAGFAYDHRNGLDSILYLQAMKDRIRWLSRQLSSVEHDRDRALEDYEQAMHKVAQLEQREWLPIEQAPKDGTELVLARWDWLIDLSDVEEGSDEWKRRLFDEGAPRTYQFCWAKNGFWSERYQNWSDGIEPSGLIPPTHFQYITAPEV